MCNAIHWESLIIHIIQCKYCGVAELIKDHYCRIRTVKQVVGRWRGGGTVEPCGRLSKRWPTCFVSFLSSYQSRNLREFRFPKFSSADSALVVHSCPGTVMTCPPHVTKIAQFLADFSNCWPEPRHRSAGNRSQGSWEGPWLRSTLSELNQFECHIGDHRSKMEHVYFC